jgi:hypothetical protein
LKWSFLRKSLGDVCFFREKVHSLSVTPESLAIWNKKLEGLESSELKKLKISPKDMYLAAPSLCPGSFMKTTRMKGPFVVYSAGVF